MSNQVPRFFTSRDAEMWELPTEIPLIWVLDSCCLVPMTWNSVFESFIRSLLVRNQVRTSETHDSMAARADLSDVNEPGLKDR